MKTARKLEIQKRDYARIQEMVKDGVATLLTGKVSCQMPLISFKMKISRYCFAIILSGLVALIGALSYTIYSNRLVFWSGNLPEIKSNYKIGERVNPLMEFDFNDGNWCAYVLVSRDDRRLLPKEIPRCSVLKTTSIATLNKLRAVKFVFTDSDQTTTTSSLRICKNSEVVFDAGIVIENEEEGLQSRNFGWIPVENKNGSLRQVISEFHKISCFDLVGYGER